MSAAIARSTLPPTRNSEEPAIFPHLAPRLQGGRIESHARNYQSGTRRVVTPGEDRQGRDCGGCLLRADWDASSSALRGGYEGRASGERRRRVGRHDRLGTARSQAPTSLGGVAGSGFRRDRRGPVAGAADEASWPRHGPHGSSVIAYEAPRLGATGRSRHGPAVLHLPAVAALHGRPQLRVHTPLHRWAAGHLLGRGAEGFPSLLDRVRSSKAAMAAAMVNRMLEPIAALHPGEAGVPIAPSL